jgi:hypothetical protein
MKHTCRFTDKAALRRLSGKIRKIKDFTERRTREVREPFPTAEIFDLSWPFHYRCRSEEERKFLIGRVRTYAFSRRRGKFKLPSRFSDLVDEVSNSSKASIRRMIFKVKPEVSAECRLLKSTFSYANRILSGCLWKSSGNVSEDCARQVDCHRLAKRDWPRVTGSLWPSSPSVPELIVMSRSGKVPDPLLRTRRVVNNHPTMQDLIGESGLATRVVANNVVGIRSSVHVPRKFLPWFRYRDGILFLTVRYSIPIGLVRLLLGEWKRNVHNLWLRTKCHLKYYLRLVPHSRSKTTEARRETVGVTPVDQSGNGGGIPKPTGFQVKPVRRRAPSGDCSLTTCRRTQHAKLT